jgi:transposase
MSKHSTPFKLSVVSAYESGLGGFREVGARFGLDHATVRKWVSIHAAHGIAGLERKYGSYDSDFKLSVLRRMWDDGLSHRQAAAIFNIRDKSSIADWERRYERGGMEALSPRRKGRPRSMRPRPDSPPETPATLSGSDTRSREAELNYLRMENAYLKN